MVEIKQESGVETINEMIKDKKWLLLNLPLKKKGLLAPRGNLSKTYISNQRVLLSC